MASPSPTTGGSSARTLPGSIAHARAQLKAGLLNREEFDAIESGLKDILKDIEEGNFTWSRELEDVHMNIESELNPPHRRARRQAAHGPASVMTRWLRIRASTAARRLMKSWKRCAACSGPWS